MSESYVTLRAEDLERMASSFVQGYWPNIKADPGSIHARVLAVLKAVRDEQPIEIVYAPRVEADPT